MFWQAVSRRAVPDALARYGEIALPRSHADGYSRSRDQVEILRNCLTEKGISELMVIAGRTSRTKFRDQVLKPLLKARWLEMTFPGKPRSSKQNYRLTEKGRRFLAERAQYPE
jgi:ATP-dependent DNA helicase RecG